MFSHKRCRSSGFTFAEFVVIVVIILILIGLLLPGALQNVREAAQKAAQFQSLAGVANKAIVTADAVQGPLMEADKLFSDLKQQQRPPNSDELAAITRILTAVHNGETDFNREFSELRNPASLHNPGELKAYLDLKTSLVEADIKLKHLEIKLEQVVSSVSPGQ